MTTATNPGPPRGGRPQTRWFAGTSLAFAAVLSGCGPKEIHGPEPGSPQPVTGQILLPDGKPMKSGRVYFIPKAISRAGGSGELDSDGKFALKTGDGTDGAPEGDYKVRVAPGEQYLTAKAGLASAKSLPFAAKHADVDGDTGLTATVKAGSNDFSFKLSPPERLVAKKRDVRVDD